MPRLTMAVEFGQELFKADGLAAGALKHTAMRLSTRRARSPRHAALPTSKQAATLASGRSRIRASNGTTEIRTTAARLLSPSLASDRTQRELVAPPPEHQICGFEEPARCQKYRRFTKQLKPPSGTVRVIH
jgi:hypothetical protein